MKTKELREFTEEELARKIRELKEELYKYRSQKVTGQMEKTHLMKHLRRDIARVNTVITERTRGEKS